MAGGCHDSYQTGEYQVFSPFFLGLDMLCLVATFFNKKNTSYLSFQLQVDCYF